MPDPAFQKQLDEEFEEWLLELKSDLYRVPRRAREAFERGDDAAFDRALYIAFLAEEFEAMIIESGEYRPILRREPDGTISTLWQKKEFPNVK